MSANTFGHLFRLTSFGESHGVALGAVIDGCPSGVAYDEGLLLRELARRRPGQSKLTTARQESDQPEILSGVFENKTLGTPIAVIVRNTDQRSQDYAAIASSPRAGHADDVWKAKFGHTDPRGGGRSSGRETLTRVIGGAFAQMMIKQMAPGLRVIGYTSQVHDIELTAEDRAGVIKADIESFAARFPSKTLNAKAEELILKARENGDSVGGIAEILVTGAPAGLGQPVFNKLKSDLAAAYFSVGATSAVEIGEGADHSKTGQQFHSDAKGAVYGGIRGGISTGDDIKIKIHFKPTSSIMDVAKKGRHDPFIVTRAVPVLEAMTYLVLADHLLWAKTDRF